MGIPIESKPSKSKNRGDWEESILQIGVHQEVYMRIIFAETKGNKVWTQKSLHPAANQDSQWGIKDTH